jgi:MFS transporter, AAHS family, 3-hydroxyphenylpropionic acid transporter
LATDVLRIPLMRSQIAHRTIALCFFAAMCEGFDVQAAGIAAGGISRAFHPTAAEFGAFFSGGNVGLLLGAVIGGRLADRIGRNSVLVLSIAMFGVSSLLTSVCWSVPSLIAFRLLTGVGLGGAMPNLIALAGQLAQGEGGGSNARIASAFIGMPVGGVIASLVVLVLPVVLWRWVFVAGGTGPLLIAIAMMKWLAESGPDRRPLAPVQALAPRSALFGASKTGVTLAIWTGFFLMQLTFQLLLNWLPLLMQAQGLSKSESAIVQVGFNLGGAAEALCIGFLLDSRWRKASVCTSALALPVFAFLLAKPALGLGPAVALTLLIGGGINAFQIILYAVAVETYPDAVRGLGVGAGVGAGRLGAIAGPAIAALLVVAGHSSTEVLASTLPVILVCSVCIIGLGVRRPRSPLV